MESFGLVLFRVFVTRSTVVHIFVFSFIFHSSNRGIIFRALIADFLPVRESSAASFVISLKFSMQSVGIRLRDMSVNQSGVVGLAQAQSG